MSISERRCLIYGLLGFVGVLTAATILGFWEGGWWGFGLLAHLRGQYCWGLLLCAVMLVWLDRSWAVLCLIPLVVNWAIVGALYWPASTQFVGGAESSLKVLHFNLDRHNAQLEAIIAYLNAQTVDLMALQEITPTWAERLPALTHYRVVGLEVRENSHGSALLVPQNSSAKMQVLAIETLHFPEDAPRPMLVGEFEVNKHRLAFLSLHVTRPRSQNTAAFQQQELGAIAQWSQTVQAQGQALIVMGDCNSTPWAKGFRAFQRDGRPVNSQQGYGWQTTWMAGWPAPLRIAIDHCLHSPGLVTVNRAIGPTLGSDHLPLIVEIDFQKAS